MLCFFFFFFFRFVVSYVKWRNGWEIEGSIQFSSIYYKQRGNRETIYYLPGIELSLISLEG